MKYLLKGRPAFYAGLALLIISGGIMGCNKDADSVAVDPKNAPGTASKPIPKDLPPEIQARIKSAQDQDVARNKAALEQGAAMMKAQNK